MDVNVFNDINDNLSKLDAATKSAIIELGFSFRDSVETVCVVFNSFEVFSKLVGTVPEKIIRDYESGKATKFYVDLESLNTDKMRLYTNYEGNGVELIGYYVNLGEIYETKVYNNIANVRPRSMSIKRYDSEMNLVDDQEVESVVGLSEWSGSKEAIDIALKNSLRVICIKKKIKNQNYLLIRK